MTVNSTYRLAECPGNDQEYLIPGKRAVLGDRDFEGTVVNDG
jgi:hypothetical protein